MREELLSGLAARLGERGTEVLWTQWAALGSGAVSKRAVTAAIDPEVLVLASLGLLSHERKLVELLGWWSRVGVSHLSVQRVVNLGAGYPSSVRRGLREFAGYAWGAGGDHRWKSLSGGERLGSRGGGRTPAWSGAGGVVLRLRLGLGVGIKADLVAALLGLPGWWSVRELAEASGYTTRAVRRAGADLARGGWVEASPSAPAEYRAAAERWLPLLELADPAPWRHWDVLFRFVVSVVDWLEAGEWRSGELAEVEGRARALVDGHRGAFKWAGVSVPEPVSRPGAEYLESFVAAASGVVERMEGMV